MTIVPKVTHTMQKQKKNPGTKPRKPGRAAGKSSLPAQRVALPAARGESWSTRFSVRASKRFKDAIVVEGSEYLTKISTPNTTLQDGQCLFNQPISPAEFAGTRLELFSRMYEKYRFEELDFEYIPSCSSTTVGSVVIAYDRDPSDDTPPASVAGLRAYTSWADARVTDVKLNARARCPLEAPDSGYYVNDSPGGDERLSDQGQIYVAIVNTPPQNTVLGTLILHYTCELFVPNMETAPPMNYSSSAGAGSFGASIDWLRNFIGGAPTKAPGSDPSYQPTLGSSGVALMRLAEGLYRLTAKGQTDGPSVGLGTPAIQLLEPKIAPAPQGVVQEIENDNSLAVANSLFMADYLVNVPTGGAEISWPMDAGTADHTLGNLLEVVKLFKGYYTGNLQNYVV